MTGSNSGGCWFRVGKLVTPLQQRVSHEFNAKLLDIAQANTMAGLNFATELMRAKRADRSL